VADLLVDGEPQVLERRGAELVHVQQEVVQVDPLRAVRRARGASGVARSRLTLRSVALERLAMVFVLGTVVGSAHRPDEGRIDMVDGVVRHRFRGNTSRRGRPGRALLRGARRDLSFEVGVDRTARVLEIPDRSAGDVLHDRL
jgi:hypothetical protein